MKFKREDLEISDMYSLSKIRADITKDKYLFCGKSGNIGISWKEAASVLGFELSQCCPKGYEMEGVQAFRDIKEAVKGKDIICTDSLPTNILGDFEHYQITKEIMNQLEILARRGYFSIPIYNFWQEYDKNGNPIWQCECKITEKAKRFFAKSSSKKDAKKASAFKMLKYVLGENICNT